MQSFKPIIIYFWGGGTAPLLFKAMLLLPSHYPWVGMLSKVSVLLGFVIKNHLQRYISHKNTDTVDVMGIHHLLVKYIPYLCNQQQGFFCQTCNLYGMWEKNVYIIHHKNLREIQK